MICAPRSDLHIRGLAVRLPGAESPDAFWSVLDEGRCTVSDTVPEGRWRPERFLSPDRAARGTAYTFAGGYLRDAYGFDAAAFGFSPREAAQMDPQQRVLLEVVWEALEDAGLPPSRLARERVGVFVGASSTDYADVPVLDLGAIGPHFMVGNSLSILANRISYALDLTGPSLTVDTACSSSLVALAQAATAIERGDVDLAIVAGVNILSSPAPFVGFSRAGMLSPTGRCRPFSARADGYVRAEGAVAVVLGRAEAKGLPARARLRAVGVNSDGRTNGISLPSAEGQRDLLAALYDRAGIDPDALSFVEAHGTGTLVGDPVEARAIGEVLGRRRTVPLPIGSVKSNIGHLECASGLAGLAKTVLALRHRHLPATLHLDAVNPAIDLAGYNLEAAAHARALPGSGPLLAGVCNYGFGGTNAHAILEGLPEPAPSDAAGPGELLVISAHTREALAGVAAAYADAVERDGAAAVARAASGTRDLLRHRLVIDPAETPDVAALLRRGTAPGLLRRGEAVAPRARTAFVFTGNGCQYPGMARQAWDHAPAFRASFEATAALIRAAGGPCPVGTLWADDAEDRLAATSAAQPALYAVQIALVDALAAQGIRPALVLGHSVGEVAAAAAAGILGRTEAARLIAARSAGQEAVRGQGRMAVLGCDAAQAARLAAEEGLTGLEIAAENAPSSTTLSGPPDAVRAAVAAARRARIPALPLDIDYPFHHALLDPARESIIAALAELSPRPGDIPLISTVSGAPLAGTTMDAAYWWSNIRRPVLFARAVEAALDHADLFIEIGPRPLLGNAMAEVARRAGRPAAVMPSLTTGAPEPGDPVRRVAAEAVSRGAVPAGWGEGRGGSLRLPTMRWHRQDFRIEPTPEAYGLYGGAFGGAACHPLAGMRVAPGGAEWRHAISLETLPFLGGHRVDGQAVFPATGFIEIMAAVGEQALGTARLRLHDLDILRALVLEPGVARELSIAWDEAERSVAIRSRRRFAEGEGFVLHARGTLQVLTGPAPNPTEPPGLTEPVDAPAVYAATARARLDYRGAFRAVAALRRGADAFVSELRPAPLDLGAFAPVMVTDPAAFDAAFHGLFLDLAPVPNAAVGELPVRIGRLSLFGPRRPPARAVARVVRRTRGTRVVDLDLLGAEGDLLARAEGVVMRRVVHATWRDEDRIVHIHPADESAHRAALHDALRRPHRAPVPAPADPVAAAMDAWARATAAELLHGAGDPAAEEPSPATVAPATVAPAARPFWHLLQDLLRETTPPRTAGHDSVPAAESAALTALARSHPEAVADLRWMAWAEGELARFLRTGTPAAPRPALAEHWLAHSRLTAPTLDAVAAAIEAAADGLALPLRVALLEPGLAGLLPRLLPALREGRLALEVLSADPPRAEATLARLGARGLVGLRDATRAPAPPHAAPELVACVATSPLDAASPSPLEQLRGLGGPPVLIGIPPHAPVLDLLHAAEAGWWDLTPTPDAPVGQWPLPAETARAAEEAGLGPVLRSELDASGAGLLVFAGAETGRRAPVAAKERPQPPGEAGAGAGSHLVLHVREAALARARELLPTFDLIPYAGAGPKRDDDPAAPAHPPVVVDLEAGPVSGELAALRQRILRLRDTAAHLSDTPGARLVVLCEGGGAPAEAARATARTLANETPAVEVHAVLPRGATPIATAQALRAHLETASPERELVIGPHGVQVPRARRARPSLRAPAPGERTVLRRGPGGLDDLIWEVEPRRAPGPGEVEVAVAATGLNFRDVMLALGLLDEEILGEGLTAGSLGFEFAGHVLSGGDGPWRPGDLVMGFAQDAFASHLTVPSASLLRAPAGLSPEAAASLPVALTTAWHALVDRAALQRGETVLIHGGAGAVGLAALGIARHLGARVIAAAGTPEKRDLLRRLGADAVVDSRAADFGAQVRAVSDGVDVVLNSVAGDAMRETLRLVRPFGRFVELGKRDFLENTRIGLRPFARNLAFLGVDLDQFLAHAPEAAMRAARAACAAVESGAIRPLPCLALPGTAVGDAFRLMQASGHVGKIVIRPAGRGQDRRPAGGGFVPAPGAHVVLGGTGGFGLATALWLADRGARHVVVASRRGTIGAAELPAVDALRARGIVFAAEGLDVTDTAAVTAAFARWRAAHGGIAGVVHAAMVLEDGLLSGVTARSLDAVLAPKVEGIRAVAGALGEDELQYLVACSSATTLVGSPGQGAYVAANAFLEGAVAELRGRGVPALAVCWGAISDTGVVARTGGLAERLRATTGVAGVTAAEALDHLGRLLENPRAAPAVSGYAVLRWTPGARKLATLRAPLFAGLFATAAAEEESGAGLDLTGLSRDAAAERLVDAIREEVAAILRLPVTEVDPDRALIDLGLDSLMALELRLGLEKRTGAELTALAALGSTRTARQLAGSLLPALLPAAGDDGTARAVQQDPPAPTAPRTAAGAGR
ncbi:SDR family NAD(P)-dependent oxidoreductase [Muricoccus radiodurans]|uniref:SDR family NAD(P)-dependent oxidoreductase n=1 Tax=Muricoccus radiodurans TaxID=2231721 RepID=UPI003CF3071F